MNSGVRYSVQRSRRAALKADAVVLLDRIAATIDTLPHPLRLQIAEMRMRLQPPVGCKAPIILTDYNRKNV